MRQRRDQKVRLAAISEEPDLTKLLAAVLGKPGRPKREDEKGVQAQVLRGTGNRDYTLVRLRRDDPETAARVKRGELSANAAAIQKGWRKPRTAYQELCSASATQASPAASVSCG